MTFEGKPIPEMVQRVKINLREREIDVFDYSGPYKPHPIYLKSRFIPRQFPKYESQLGFDTKLTALRHLDLSGFGPSRDEFDRTLLHLGLAVRGFDLLPAS